MDWIEDIVVVNENGDPNVAGDVMIFRSAGDACRYVEPWYVEQEAFLALSGTGEQVVFGVRDDVVIVERRASFSGGRDLLLAWLSAKAQHRLKVRAERALEATGVLPDTIEGLVAYLGFDD